MCALVTCREFSLDTDEFATSLGTMRGPGEDMMRQTGTRFGNKRPVWSCQSLRGIPVVRSLTMMVLFAAVVESAVGAGDDTMIAGFTKSHCVDCHQGDDAESGFVLDGLPLALDEPDNFRLWSQVLERVRKGEMPPAEAAQPSAEQRSALIDRLHDALAKADRQRQQKFGRRELRRLSRAEYANSLRDILDLPHLELEERLPPDGLAHGYSRSASALDFSHVMVSRYLDVADYALWQALAPHVDPVPRQIVRAELKSVKGVRDTLQTLYVQLKQTSGMPLVGTQIDPTLKVNRGNFQKREPGYVRDPEPLFDGVATFMNSRSNHNVVVKPFKVQQSGTYKLRVHGWGLLNDHGKLLPSDRTETVAFYSPTGRLLGRCDVPPNRPTTSETTVWLNAGEPIEYLAISAPNELFNIPLKGDNRRYDKFKAYGIGLQWFEMEGPLEDRWPSESHHRLLGDMPLEPTEDVQPNGLAYRVLSENPLDDARRLIRRFATRALRRPVNDADIALPMRMVRPRLRRGEPFVDALLAGYRAVLTSPELILLQENPGTLDARALAARLSFFLWNSPPDAGLRAAAESGALLQDDELRKQTERLLADQKSRRFVEHFLDYWLDLRNIRLTEPDENLYPEFNSLLTESMLEETQAYFAEMLKDDLGAMHVVDSDFVTINQRMAELYGIPNVLGSQTRRVPLDESSVRGGLITQGSLLKITANGTTTSPVVRGTFAMTKLLGDPPPPPPASVPAIEPDISGATTIREQLAKHRSVALCASCHQKIDPPGFALESFDVMGAWRTRYRATVEQGQQRVNQQFNGKPANFRMGLEVDSAGELPGGAKFADINEFRRQLRAHEPQIARNLLEQLIIYATGTPVGYADEAITDEMLQRLAASDYGVRSMIHEIIQSELFRKK